MESRTHATRAAKPAVKTSPNSVKTDEHKNPLKMEVHRGELRNHSPSQLAAWPAKEKQGSQKAKAQIDRALQPKAKQRIAHNQLAPLPLRKSEPIAAQMQAKQIGSFPWGAIATAEDLNEGIGPYAHSHTKGVCHPCHNFTSTFLQNSFVAHAAGM